MSDLAEAKEMIEDLYDRSCVGCCLHIVTDDGNIEDNHVNFCVERAQESGHKECEDLAKLIQKMSMLERAHLLDMWWCPKHKEYTLHKVCGMDGCNTKAEPLKQLDN